MATTTTRLPATPAPTTARPRTVETVLHELAYVLHVTRKVCRPAALPTPTARPQSAEAAHPASSA